LLASGADFVYRPPVAAQTIEATTIAHNRRIRLTASERLCLNQAGVGDGDRKELSIESPKSSHSPVEIGPMRFDIESNAVTIRGNRATLSTKPMDVLYYLAMHHGECCTRLKIIDDVWDLEFDPGTNIVDVQIYKIRKFLDSYDLREMVQTVRGRGYRLVWPLDST
jgi:DNA-binding response OmpR family regulator